MKQYEERGMLSRRDIAARLRLLADEVERGSISAGGIHASVPDQAEFELELEPDELEVKIEWR